MHLKNKILSLIFLPLISCSTSKFVRESPGSEDVNLVTSVDQNQCEYIVEVKDKVKGYSDDFLGT
ncbi:MAG: hypothetical protein P8I00_04915, partial [Methylophilaceae bacterium]|nr:hypothetical protein [Methylophilaceae bacterium]